jgi:hypothetical protein
VPGRRVRARRTHVVESAPSIQTELCRCRVRGGDVRKASPSSPLWCRALMGAVFTIIGIGFWLYAQLVVAGAAQGRRAGCGPRGATLAEGNAQPSKCSSAVSGKGARVCLCRSRRCRPRHRRRCRPISDLGDARPAGRHAVYASADWSRALPTRRLMAHGQQGRLSSNCSPGWALMLILAASWR